MTLFLAIALNICPGERQVHQGLVSSNTLGAARPIFRMELHVSCVRTKNPRLPLIAETGIEDLPKALLGA